MLDAHSFLTDLAVVLCVAAVTAVVFRLLRQPVVLGYVLAGLIIGPHVPVPLVADLSTVQMLSELGVILLMFSLGLEFSIRKLMRLGVTASIIGAIEVGAVMWLGVSAARALGWSVRESLFAGAAMCISSTMIVAKVFAEQKVDKKVSELVFGVLIVEDLIAIVLLALLTAVGSGLGLDASELVHTTGRLAGFLTALVVVGLLVVPRMFRLIARLGSPETLLLASIGLSFALALAASAFGYSVALGAFIAGALVAESGASRKVEHLIHPVRDMFSAIFFVSVGMMMDPALIAENWHAVLLFTAVVFVGKIAGVFFGTFLTGHPVQLSARAAMSLAQIGEFSFIIAVLGRSLKVTGDFLFAVAVGVSVLTTFTTPLLVRLSVPAALALDRRLPQPLQMFVTLYGSWLDAVRASQKSDGKRSPIRRLVKLLILDGAMLIGLIIGTSMLLGRVGTLVEASPIPAGVANALVVGLAMVIAAPLLWGVVGMSRRLGTLLAESALPYRGPDVPDLANAPRRVLVLVLQLAVILVIGLPVLAVTQPLLPAGPGAVLIGVPIIALGVLVWRGTRNLQGHLRAGSEMLIEVLKRQSSDEPSLADEAPLTKLTEQVRALLPGCGELHAVELDEHSHATGRTLAELNLRGLTGASVLVLVRDGDGRPPDARETLRAGDVLALTGSADAVSTAETLLRKGPAREASEAAA